MSFILTEEKFNTFCDIMYETNKAKADRIEYLEEKMKILEDKARLFDIWLKIAELDDDSFNEEELIGCMKEREEVFSDYHNNFYKLKDDAYKRGYCPKKLWTDEYKMEHDWSK